MLTLAWEKRIWIRYLQPKHQTRAVIRSGEYLPERPLLDLLAPGPVLSPSRITLENNKKIRPQPDRENTFAQGQVAEGTGPGPNSL